jgi:hypothetical protein
MENTSMDTNANILSLPKRSQKPVKQAKVARVRKMSLRQYLALGSAASIGLVAVGATALSLTDLADSIGDVAHIAAWKSYALAIALDLNFVATESFSLFATAAVANATHKATMTTKAITLLMSAVANSWAMAHGADGMVMQGACVVAGCSVPALIALATYTLGKAVRA